MIVPKHLFFVWLQAHNKLLTQERLIRMHIIDSGSCFFCGDAQETQVHLYFQCCYSRMILNLIVEWCKVATPDNNIIEWWLKWRHKSATKKKIIGVILAATIYHIWLFRNRARLECNVVNAHYAVKCIKSDVICRLETLEKHRRTNAVHLWVDSLRR